jgi:carbon monoxide dehydrogenase subunit G
MISIESKTGIANANQEVVYKFLSDFRNFADLLPEDQMKDAAITAESMEFNITGIGLVGLMISEKHPYHQLVIKSTDGSTADFTLWLNLKELSPHQSEVNITFQARLNPFLEMMARNPLQHFVDLMMDKLSELKFNKA